MALRQFVFVVLDEPTDGQVTELFVRADDLTIEFHASVGRASVAFDRDAPTAVDAIVSAVRDLDGAGLTIAEVTEDDDLVTVATIAERTGRSPEAIGLMVSGATGPGGFPAPVDRAATERCFRWREVAPWLSTHQGYEVPNADPAIEAVNLGLRLRALAPRVERIGVLRSLLP